MSLRLGIDIGTTGVRSSVIGLDHRVVADARVLHVPQSPHCIDAREWVTAVERCLTAQIERLREVGRDPLEISGLAVDGTSGSMVLTDRSFTPVSRALMYNSKGFEREASLINTYAPKGHVTRGNNSALARALRLLWEAESEPAHLLHQADFVVAYLVEHGGFSDHNNALKTGFDPEAEAWPGWIGTLLPPEILPKALPVGSAIAQIAPNVADRFGLSRQVTVYAGTTDSIAAFLAAGTPHDRVAVTSLGSTLAVKMLNQLRIQNFESGLLAHRLPEGWVIGGASNTGGAVLESFFSAERMRELCDGMDTEQDTGLDLYPLPRPGERFPTNDPSFAPRLSPRPSNDQVFLQALFEGMARIEARAYQVIEASGGARPDAIMTVGGGAENKAWTAVRRRILGIPIIPAGATEASIGVAGLAGSGV